MWGLERQRPRPDTNSTSIAKFPQSTVISRKARYSYGVMLNEFFDNKHHDVNDRFFDEQRDEWMAREQMSWFIKQVSDFIILLRLTANLEAREMIF